MIPVVHALTRPLAKLALVGGILAGLIGASTAGNALAAERSAEPFTWEGRLATGRTLHVTGLNGEIVARAGTGDRVEIRAQRHARRDDPEAVRIEVNPTRDGLAVCAIYPGMRHPVCDDDARLESHGNTDVKVDFEITLPAGVDLHARNVNGGIEALGLTGKVSAHTVNGSVDLETSASAEGQSVNGNVNARVGRVPAGGRLSFSTVNGSVRVQLPEGVDCELHGSTVNGAIDSEFPVSVSGRWGPRHMEGTLGRGGARIELSTVNGTIRLEKHERSS